MYLNKLALLSAYLFLVSFSNGDQIVAGQDEPVDQEERSTFSSLYPQAQPFNLTAYITSLFGPIPSAPPISSFTRPPLTSVPPTTTVDQEEDDLDDETWTPAPKKVQLLDSSTSTAAPKKSRSAPPPNNPFNISFKERDVSTYLDYVQNHVSFHYQLAYLDSLSDMMRLEGKFLSEDHTIEFGQVLYSVLETHKNSTDEIWSKKTERKIIRRFLKFILAIDPDKFLAGKTAKNMSAAGCGGSSYEANFKWLSKPFFELLLAHNVTEGYEILMEVLIIRNVNLTLEQLQDIQCLYYESFGGLRDGKSYLFPVYDGEWLKRNELFNRTVMTSSITNIVEATISEDDSGPKRKPSPELLQMLSVFSEVLQRVELQRKRLVLSQPLQFHKLVQRLEPKFLALAKTDNFLDVVDTKDLFAATVAQAVINTLVHGNGTLVFHIENRQDLTALHQLRLAGVSTLYYAYEEFWKVQIVKRVRDLYSNGGRFRHLFTNVLRQIRFFPLGPMLLQGCETLNQLMLQTPPRDAESSKSRITTFATTLHFLQAMWSRDDFTVHSLPEQVQILTEHGVNQLLKLMIIIPATGKTSETSFAEVGVRRNSSSGAIDELVVVPIRSDRDDEDAGLETLWQVHLGWVKSSSEAYIEPTIKMKIMLAAGDYDGELTVNERENRMAYKQGFDESKGFWDLALTRGSTAFQLIYHDGGLESFFQLEGDPDQGVRLRPKHFMMHQLPESFVPAQFFVVPADE